MRVTTVSIETMKITDQMKATVRELVLTFCRGALSIRRVLNGNETFFDIECRNMNKPRKGLVH